MEPPESPAAVQPPATTAPVEAEVEPLPPQPAPAPRRSTLGRVWGWFWRGKELKAARQWQRQRPAAAVILEGRARLLFECGERTIKPSEPLPAPGHAVAANLYRQSAYFAVRALAYCAGAPSDDRAAWRSLDAAVMQRLGGDPAELEATVETQSDEIWQLPPLQQAQQADHLRRLALELLSELEAPARARDGLLLQRMFRLGGIVLLLLAAFGVQRYLAEAADARRDLAANKPWRASSAYSTTGCTSPAQQCSESPDFFFHTREETNPWVEIDLGARMRFTAVRVINRRDCCFERAVPLILEVSDDQQTFREIARKDGSFSSWLASIRPTEARWVRLRTPSRAPLHLAQVRVLR